MEERMLFEFADWSTGDSLLMYENKVILNQRTWNENNSCKTIYYEDITAVRMKPAAGLALGRLQLSLAEPETRTGGIYRVENNENTVTFFSELNELAKMVCDYIDYKRKQPSSKEQVSVADELLKLKKLYDEGVLTQKEFEVQKARVLDQSNQGYRMEEQEEELLGEMYRTLDELSRKQMEEAHPIGDKAQVLGEGDIPKEDAYTLFQKVKRADKWIGRCRWIGIIGFATFMVGGLLYCYSI